MSVLEIVLYSVIGLAVIIYIFKSIKQMRKEKKKTEKYDDKGNIIDDADEND